MWGVCVCVLVRARVLPDPVLPAADQTVGVAARARAHLQLHQQREVIWKFSLICFKIGSYPRPHRLFRERSLLNKRIINRR